VRADEEDKDEEGDLEAGVNSEVDFGTTVEGNDTRTDDAEELEELEEGMDKDSVGVEEEDGAG
jgi:hypothetical protein